jgi:hypothetical protein
MFRGFLRHRRAGDLAMSANAASPLEALAEKAGRDFQNLIQARERTRVGLEERRARLGDLQHSAGTSIVLMGSWGRAEVTAGSDDDSTMSSDTGGRSVSILPVKSMRARTSGRCETRSCAPPKDPVCRGPMTSLLGA